MAQVVYRANLSSPFFPLLSSQQGHSVIVPGIDENYSRLLATSADVDKDIGIPQLYYAQNVVPTNYGYQSLAYTTYTLAPGDILYDTFLTANVGPTVTIGIGYTVGRQELYILRSDRVNWIYLNVTIPIGGYITQAVVNGVAYIFIPDSGCYTYNILTDLLIPVTLTALDLLVVVGITCFRSYLIAYTLTAVAWSSTVDPTDFTPSTVTGAGGANINGLQGVLIFGLTHTQGFVLYSNFNVITAQYSGNGLNPFVFTAIGGSSGILDPLKVVQDPQSSNHIQLATSGLYTINMKQTTAIYSNIGEFIFYRGYEEFDEISNVFTLTTSKNIFFSLSIAADKYVCFSYGLAKGNYTYSILLDTILLRLGKIKLPHVSLTSLTQSMIGLDKYGGVSNIQFDYLNLAGSGVALFGKYQLSRANTCSLLAIELEGLGLGECSVSTACSYSGNNKSFVPAYEYLVDGVYKRFLCKQSGFSHSILVKGSFSIDCLVLTLNQSGRR